MRDEDLVKDRGYVHDVFMLRLVALVEIHDDDLGADTARLYSFANRTNQVKRLGTSPRSMSLPTPSP